MEKYNNLIQNPTHSFNLGFYTTEDNTYNVSKDINIFRFNNHLVSCNGLKNASKLFSEYFDYTVDEDEIEVLGKGVVYLG